MKITDKHGQQWQLVPIDSLKIWLDLVEINPRDLAPRIASMIHKAPEPELEELFPHPPQRCCP